MGDRIVEQEGGEHYQKPVQHWDWAQYIGYLEGCATKYIGRHAEKGHLQDIKKGLTFIDKICRKYYSCRLEWRLVTFEHPSDYKVSD